MKVVIDTNVLVSALLKPHSKPAIILNLVISGKHIPCFDSRIFDEYERVLSRKKFGFDASLVDLFLHYLEKAGIFVTPAHSIFSLPDPFDIPFYEVAISTNAVIITGNKKHFPVDNIDVFYPSDFLETNHT
jgi:putative PIN family toxin of toxin-antitoxin system